MADSCDTNSSSTGVFFFLLKILMLELDGILKKRKDLVSPGPSSGHYKRRERGEKRREEKGAL